MITALWHPCGSMSQPPGRVLFQFGKFELDAAADQLRCEGTRVRLARQPMDSLFLLVDRPRELVSRDEIIRTLWPESVFVDSDAGIHTAVLRIRQALGTAGGQTAFVETCPVRGIALSRR